MAVSEILFVDRQPMPPAMPEVRHLMSIAIQDDGRVVFGNASRDDDPDVMTDAMRAVLAQLLEHPAILRNACGEANAARELFQLWDDIDGR